MNGFDPQSFIPLKTHWFHILLCLAGGEQHGYGIMQEVLDRTTGRVRLWPATSMDRSSA
jgi:DNA-binding PadR family transcriptional regulator